MKRPFNPFTGEVITTISELDQLVQDMTPDVSPDGLSAANEPFSLVERAMRNAARARVDEAMGMGPWAQSVGADGISETKAIHSAAKKIISRALSHSREHPEFPEGVPDVQSDLGGGINTFRNHGTLDPNRLADITERHGYGWNPESRRVELGVDVRQGNRHVFVPMSERGGVSEAIAGARRTLENGDGYPVAKKNRRY